MWFFLFTYISVGAMQDKLAVGLSLERAKAGLSVLCIAFSRVGFPLVPFTATTMDASPSLPVVAMEVTSLVGQCSRKRDLACQFFE